MLMLTKQKMIQSHFPKDCQSKAIQPLQTAPASASVKKFLSKINLIPCVIYWIKDERLIIWLQKKYKSWRTNTVYG